MFLLKDTEVWDRWVVVHIGKKLCPILPHVAILNFAKIHLSGNPNNDVYCWQLDTKFVWGKAAPSCYGEKIDIYIVIVHVFHFNKLQYLRSYVMNNLHFFSVRSKNAVCTNIKHNIIDTSINCPISGQSTSMANCFMNICLIW